MKRASLTCVALGLVCGILATLTAIHAFPAFLNASSGFSAVLLTCVFWTCTSGLLMLSAIALALISLLRELVTSK
jgi:hypothetical protein